MKYRVEDKVLLRGTIVRMDDGEFPYRIDIDNDDPDEGETCFREESIFALIKYGPKPKTEMKVWNAKLDTPNNHRDVSVLLFGDRVARGWYGAPKSFLYEGWHIYHGGVPDWSTDEVDDLIGWQELDEH